MIGHRGAPGYLPEHTRASYLLAIAQGADLVEPDLVVSADGVLVVRHENEISRTTDVAAHPEFADRRVTKVVDDVGLTGWFTEDFTWAELQTLRAREPLPDLRPSSARFDGTEPMLRLRELLDLVRASSREHGREIGLAIEIKHATYFARHGWDVAELVAAELTAAGWANGESPLIIESFESTVLAAVRARGVVARYVYLVEATGSPADLRAAGGDVPDFSFFTTPGGMDRLIGRVDGISVDKRIILAPDRRGRTRGPSRVVTDAHERGLIVLAWTCRPENRYLIGQFRAHGGPAAFGDYEGEWTVIREAGVDGVFVDHPDLGVRLFS